MVERRGAFERAARLASTERRDGEQALVQRLADDFRRDSGAFDPRRLSYLSPLGWVDLLKTLEISPAGGKRPFLSGLADTPQPDQWLAAGWANLRRPERSAWLAGVASGSAFGILVLLFAFLVSFAFG
ncbi:conserved hypothetical protein [Hyphomicrobiales bacterium]|nr:conserved hypothetical protein [Hyphomicrobiales bacterium]CAH1677227.1 conserved hypothetical protein [Hyphomicrobiales bacterium]